MVNKDVLTEEQKAAVAELSQTNKYAHQSTWKTFKELPMKDKWPYFVQHFLLSVVIVVAVVGFAVAMTVTYLTKPPQMKLDIVSVNMGDASTQLDHLEQGLAKDSGLDAKLMDARTNLTIDMANSNAYSDSTVQLFASIASGDVNTVISNEETMEVMCVERGLVSSLDEALGTKRADALREKGVVVSMDVPDAGDTGVALDLTKSSVWNSLDGADELGDDVLLAFANVTETGTEYPRALVDYLFDL